MIPWVLRPPYVRAARWPLLLLLVLLPAMTPRPARAIEERAWVSLELSADLYDPEQSAQDHFGYGARGAGFLNRWAGVEGIFHRSSPKLEAPADGSGSFTHYGLGVILTPDRFRWTLPYIYGGVGSAKLSRDDVTESGSHSAIHFGGGIVVRLGEKLGFRLDGRDVAYKQEGGPGRDTRVNAIVASGAVTAFFAGRSRDTDEDGVPDRRDRCNETPHGAVVDASGCPLDTDHDKVFDGLDKCPDTPAGAVVDAAGCSVDSDKDGVADGIDACNDTPQGVLVDAKGCSLDTDQDGVADGPDKCPGTPAGATVDASGCPTDSDGDGVADGVDVCPGTPAGVAVNAGGCPLQPTSSYERQLIQDWMIRLSDLAFVPDSSRLLPAGMARLDSVAVALRQWPMLKIEIGAHVDDTVPPGYRVPLSTQRAQAVARYLFQQAPNLDPKNFSLTGYGDTEPIVSNRTAAARARNRRIEFKVLNPNVLSQERQRRASFGASGAATPPPGTAPETPPPPPPGGETPNTPPPGGGN